MGEREAKLETIVTKPIHNVLSEHSKENVNLQKIDSKIKLSSTDVFEKEIIKLNYQYNNGFFTLQLGNVGGTDAFLSLYSNLIRTTGQRTPAHMFVIDRKPSHINNMFFRTILGSLNETRADYLNDLFGLHQTKLTMQDLEEKKFMIQELPKILKSQKKYSSKQQSEVFEKLNTLKNKLDEKDYQLFQNSIQIITNYLETGTKFSHFAKSFVETAELNPHTFYLNNDELYKPITKVFDFSGGSPKFYLHGISHDVSTPEGITALETILKTYDFSTTKLSKNREKEIDVAFIPHLEHNSKYTAPFLKNYSQTVVQSKRQQLGGKRSWLSKQTSKIILPQQFDKGMEKYEQEIENRVEFKNINKIKKYSGLPRTMFLSGLNLGHKLADEKTMHQLIDIINHGGVDQVFMGNMIYGSHQYNSNKLRQLNYKKHKNLDKQLYQLKSFMDKIEAPITYIPMGSDWDVMEDLSLHYLMEKKQREGDEQYAISKSSQYGKDLTGGKISPKQNLAFVRDLYNEDNDLARLVIGKYIYPASIRSGTNLSKFYKQEDVSSIIIDLVEALSYYDEHGKLKKEHEHLIDEKYLENTDDLVIASSYSNFYNQGKTGLRVFDMTKFTNSTQYVNPTDALSEIIKMSKNGTLNKELPETYFADMSFTHHMVKYFGNKIMVTIPDLIDDKRALDPIINYPKVQADPVHKRISIKKTINHPGATIVSGNPEYISTIKPIFPKVIENMELVQKTGKPFPKVTAYLVHDVQLNSITERLKMYAAGLDYALYSRGATRFWGVGDFVQGRNYQEMPNENAILSGLGISNQQRVFTELTMPYLRVDNGFDEIIFVPGNHEWNSDRNYTGSNYMDRIVGSVIEMKRNQPDRDLSIIAPEFVVLGNGDLIKHPSAFTEVNGYGILMQHMYSQKGAGKGNGNNPTTHITSFLRNIEDLAHDYDMAFGAHYHIPEMMIQDNKFAAILGAYAGESGYEFARQYGGSIPTGAIVDFHEDGSFSIDIMSEKFYELHKPQAPFVKEVGGFDQYVMNAATEVVHVLAKETDPVQELYRRSMQLDKGDTPKSWK